MTGGQPTYTCRSYQPNLYFDQQVLKQHAMNEVEEISELLFF